LVNYEIGNVIGEGNFAVVRECTDINTGLKFALKIIDLRKCKGKEFMIENELKILRKIKHTNIIKLVEEYRSEYHFYLIIELIRVID
jgi:doublecortin-like kinase 1/2